MKKFTRLVLSSFGLDGILYLFYTGVFPSLLYTDKAILIMALTCYCYAFNASWIYIHKEGK
jgi:hypothetical protein